MERKAYKVYTKEEVTWLYGGFLVCICPECNKEVTTGAPGVGNLNSRHIGSFKCEMAQWKAGKRKDKPTKAIMKPKVDSGATAASSSKDFFANFRKPNAPKVPTVGNPPPLIRSQAPSQVAAQHPQSTQPSLWSAVCKRLVAAASHLPETRPVSANPPFLSSFVRRPDIDDDPALSDEGIWEYVVNPALHDQLGYENQHDVNKKLATATREGVEGFARWLDYFIEKRAVSEGMVELRLNRLIEPLEALPPIESALLVLPPLPTLSPPGIGDILVDPIEVSPDVENSETTSLPPPSSTTLHVSNVKAGKKQPSPCKGYTLPFPPGCSPHSSYPFGLHDKLALPWSFSVNNGKMVLFSSGCGKKAVEGSEMCGQCSQLKDNSKLVGIVERMRDGIREGTPYAFYGVAGLTQTIRMLHRRVEHYRLRNLNQARALMAKTRALSEFKRLLVAMASKKVENVDRIIRIGLKQKRGVRHMLGQCLKAAEGLYRPKSFEEEDYMRGLVLWRLGGDRIASIAHRALGLPSITTLRNQTRVQPILPSPGRPTVEEVSSNVQGTFEGLLETLKPGMGARNRHAVFMLDEIATEKRIRWDSRTNKFLGVCREHAHKVSLDFNSELDMHELYRALDEGEVHHGADTTVGAIGILSDDHSIYAPRVVLLSSDCKREDGKEHARVIQTCIDGVNEHQLETNIRLVSIASDGETRRGSALIDLTFKKVLSSTSEIHDLLSPLPFMNLHVGEDDITADKDWKHVFKRMRNLLLRARGVVIGGVRITPSVLEAHFNNVGMEAAHVKAIMNPNDKQDVLLAFELLKAIWCLPRESTKDNPSFNSARNTLWILGRLLYHTVYPYLGVDLTLEKQLEHLSAAAHLALFLYRGGGKEFLPTLLYVDLMIMIKNVFFCVAKTKIDDPDGSVWIILLGTDRLEQLFGTLRTMIGSDANLDLLQLCWRVGGAIEAANILARFPHWDRPPRRLELPLLTQEMKELPKATDHLKPRSWRASLKVNIVTLQTAWKTGRRIVEAMLPEAAVVFAVLDTLNGSSRVDILAPNGTLLVTSAAVDEKNESMDDETPSGSLLTTPELATASEQRVEVEDVFENEFGPLPSSGSQTRKVSNTVLINGKDMAKSRALAVHSKYRNVSSSTDRLKRVQEVQRYTPTASNEPPSNSLSNSDEELLLIHDPIVSLLCSDGRIWLCLGEVNGIRVDGKRVEQVKRELLVEDAVQVSFQLVGLRPSTLEEDRSARFDWRSCRASESTFSIPGRYIEPVDPEVATTTSLPTQPFYLFDSQFLVALASLLLQRCSVKDLRAVPKTATSTEFPYREASGKACFLCEDERDFGDLGLAETIECELCHPAVILDANQRQRILEHNAAHLLHDSKLKSSDMPCGGCLRPHPLCQFFVIPGKGANTSLKVDWKRSTCKYIIKFNYATTAESSKSSPCTNVPIICPICGPSKPAIWKYNMREHFKAMHPSQSLTEPRYTSLWELTNFEKYELKQIWAKRQKQSVAKSRTGNVLIVYSDTHCTRNVASTQFSGLLSIAGHEGDDSEGGVRGKENEEDDGGQSAASREVGHTVDEV